MLFPGNTLTIPATLSFPKEVCQTPPTRRGARPPRGPTGREGVGGQEEVGRGNRYEGGRLPEDQGADGDRVRHEGEGEGRHIGMSGFSANFLPQFAHKIACTNYSLVRSRVGPPF